MSPSVITQDEVIARTVGLPGFPRIVAEILASLDDPESNLNELSDYISHDPVIAARVMSVANRAAERTRNNAIVRDIYTATSLIGMSHVREIALLSSVGQFAQISAQGCLSDSYWSHSVAVGVCAQELAIHIAAPISSDLALIAGLLHDIGQLWLFRFHGESFIEARELARTQSIGIESAELALFGVDHAQIGAWLAEHWELPANIVAAIRHHHQPGSALTNLLVPIVSIAEVLSNALDLGGRAENKVTSISGAACAALGLNFDKGIQPLLGRIEARSRHANTLFSSHAGQANSAIQR